MHLTVLVQPSPEPGLPLRKACGLGGLRLDWLDGFHLVALAQASGGVLLAFSGRCQAGIVKER